MSNFISLGFSPFLIFNKTKNSAETKSHGQFAIKMPPGVMNAARQILSTDRWLYRILVNQSPAQMFQFRCYQRPFIFRIKCSK